MMKKILLYLAMVVVSFGIGFFVFNPVNVVNSHCGEEHNDMSKMSLIEEKQKEKTEKIEESPSVLASAGPEEVETSSPEVVVETEKPKVKEVKKKKKIKPTATPNPRKEVVATAKSYKGKITYLWGGKPTDSEISGKVEPKKLDCSGFIQFVYSKCAKKRITNLGSTISISGLKKINKKELKPGDIGLKRGKGSLYYDADGKAYSEPQFAEKSNKKKLDKIKKELSSCKKKAKKYKSKWGKAEDKIDEYNEKIKEESQAKIVEGDVENADFEEKKEEKKENIESLKENITKEKKIIKKYKKKNKKNDKKKKKITKLKKKYEKDIEKKIDHVGIYCGKDKKGNEMWCHCSSSGGGVVYEKTKIFKHYFRYLK